MPNTILKRWNGSAFEELYPKTTVTQISASGSPSISTFLRGDGAWATPAGGGTVTSVTGTSPIVSSGGNTPAISLAASYGDTQNPYASKTAKNFLAAPNAANGVPTFRAMVASDLPSIGNITNAGAIGSTSGLVAVTTTSGVLTTEAKFTNLYTNSTPLTIASGGTQTITFSASASTTGAGTTGNPGTRLRIVWGTTTSTELVTYVTVKPDAGSAPLTYIAEPLDVISGGDVTALLHIKANATGAYTGTSWIVGGGKTRTPAGSDTNLIMYLRSIDRVNF